MGFIAPIVAAVGTAVGSASLGTIATVAGAGLSAVSAIGQGNAQASRARYAAQVAENNAQIAKNNAKTANQAGAIRAEEVGLKNAQIAGQIRAGQAANGVDVNTGSNVDVQSSQRETGRLDTENTIRNANLQAYGYRTQASNFEANAALSRREAEDATTSGYLNATAGLIGKASQLPSWKVGGSSGSAAPGSPLELHPGYV